MAWKLTNLNSNSWNIKSKPMLKQWGKLEVLSRPSISAINWILTPRKERVTKWLRLKRRNPKIRIRQQEEVPTDPKQKGNTHHGNSKMTVMAQDLTAIKETSSTPSEMNCPLLQQSLHRKTKETWICGVNITRNIGTHFRIAMNWGEFLTSMLMKGNWPSSSTVVHQERGITLTNENTEK